MLINEITIKNFRIHDDKNIVFDKGINLILGENGVGKTSIIEALGIALFDANPRNGILSDAVKIGMKNAVIIVDFTGNDGNDYLIERKIGSINQTKLYKKGEKESRLEGKEQVYNKIKDLAGINAEIKNVFQNIITANQNTFINIFKDKNIEKEKTFNQIFDTAIYRAIYDGFSKKAIDIYAKEYDQYMWMLIEKKNQIKDDKILKDDLSKLDNNLKKHNNKKKILKKDINFFEENKAKLIDKKNRIAILNQKIIYNKEFVEKSKEIKNRAVLDYEESKKAKNLVIENQKKYIEYEDKIKQYNDIINLINDLEEKEKNKNILKDELNKICSDITVNEEKIINFKRLIEEKKKELKLREDRLKNLSDEFNKSYKTKQINTEELKKENKIYDEYIILFNRRNNIIKKTDEINIHKQYLDKEKIDINKLKNDIKILADKKEKLIKLKTEKELLIKEREKYIIFLAENEKAKKELSGGICPYLNEECRNIKNGKSIDDYFGDRNKKFNNEINRIGLKINEFINVENDLQEVEFTIKKYEGDIKINKEKNYELIQCNKDLESYQKDLELIKYRIKDLFLENDYFDKDIINIDLDLIKEKLANKKTEIETNLNNLTKELNDKEEFINNEKKQKENFEKFIKSEELKLEDIIILQDNLKNKKEDINIKIKNFESDTDKLSPLKKDANILNDELNKLKESHEIYVSNIQKANEIDKYNNEIIEQDKIINETEMNLKKLLDNLNNLNNEYSEEKLNEIIIELDKKNNEMQNIIEQIKEIEVNINFKNKEIEDNNKMIDELNIIEANTKYINKKMLLLKKIRDKLKYFGKHVAVHLLKRIEIIATQNFRNITGRSEEVRWINNEEESYTIYLCKSEDYKEGTKFDLLSGGEQVAVAISIRAAMISLFTRSNFTIFDEPTINLDLERRSALAENLSEILKDLEQAIIITHDDIFSEMAQKVISIL